MTVVPSPEKGLLRERCIDGAGICRDGRRHRRDVHFFPLQIKQANRELPRDRLQPVRDNGKVYPVPNDMWHDRERRVKPLRVIVKSFPFPVIVDA